MRGGKLKKGTRLAGSHKSSPIRPPLFFITDSSFFCHLLIKRRTGIGITDQRTQDIELSTVAGRPDDNHSQDLDDSNVFGRAEDGEVFSLPPADGGKDAWLFLASCVVFEAISWGKSFAKSYTILHSISTLSTGS